MSTGDKIALVGKPRRGKKPSNASPEPSQTPVPPPDLQAGAETKLLEVEDLRAENHRLKTELLDELLRLEHQLDRKDEAQNRNLSEIDDLRDKLEFQEREHRRLASKVEELSTVLHDLRGRHASVCEQRDHLEFERGETRGQLLGLTAQLSRAEADHQALVRELQRVEHERARLEREYREACTRSHLLGEELQEHREKLHRAEADRTRLEQELEAASKHHTQHLAAHEQALAALRERSEDAATRLTRRLHELRAENHNLAMILAGVRDHWSYRFQKRLWVLSKRYGRQYPLLVWLLLKSVVAHGLRRSD
ncbi:MAG: hypothetical protein A2284_16705 [Deltaproteobacteria bacterium RIFOXYA12_FULL_61_11]|nr:MAG: hypothetical protein A2284_16705 [Deltaproteobacteria bacterium RIFOXYA12_FULL_61_11]